MTDRNEEARRLRELRLLRDERDREGEQAARGTAGSVLTVLALLLCAACLLQGSPAWTGFLALVLAGSAGRCGRRWTMEREEPLFLVAAVLCALAAIALGVLFLHGLEGAGAYSLKRLAAFAALSCALYELNGLVFLPLVLGALWLVGKGLGRDPEGWDAWFRARSTTALLLWLGGLMAAAAAVTALLACLLFTALRFPDPEKLALIYLLGCWLLMFRKFSGSREELLRKLLRLKPGKSAPAPPPDPGEGPGEDRP